MCERLPEMFQKQEAQTEEKSVFSFKPLFHFKHKLQGKVNQSV